MTDLTNEQRIEIQKQIEGLVLDYEKTITSNKERKPSEASSKIADIISKEVRKGIQ